MAANDKSLAIDDMDMEVESFNPMDFIKGAGTTPSAKPAAVAPVEQAEKPEQKAEAVVAKPKATPKKAKAKQAPVLVLSGNIENRDANCRKGEMVYVCNDIDDFINDRIKHSSRNAIFNHLMRLGIAALEKQAEKEGVIFADFETAVD